jgi:hypothetical protein
MEGQRFDELTRVLCAAHSRRRVIRTLGAGVLGGVIGLVKSRQVRASGDTTGGECSLDTDCPGAETCENGVCVAGCAEEGDDCAVDADCCAGNCVAGVCAEPNVNALPVTGTGSSR